MGVRTAKKETFFSYAGRLKNLKEKLIANHLCSEYIKITTFFM